MDRKTLGKTHPLGIDSRIHDIHPAFKGCLETRSSSYSVSAHTSTLGFVLICFHVFLIEHYWSTWSQL